MGDLARAHPTLDHDVMQQFLQQGRLAALFDLMASLAIRVAMEAEEVDGASAAEVTKGRSPKRSAAVVDRGFMVGRRDFSHSLARDARVAPASDPL